jgi:hypothetical protein
MSPWQRHISLIFRSKKRAHFDDSSTKYSASYEEKATNVFARRMQQRIETVLPAIVVAKRDAYYIMRNNVSGFKPQPFAPFGAIMGGDVSK